MADNPKLYLQYLQETGQTDKARAFEEYLRETGQLDDPMAKYHAAFRSGRLQKNAADRNAADRIGRGDYFSALILEPFATVASGVPGAKLLASKIGSKVSGDTMENTQREINERTSDVPYASKAAQMVGTMALAPVLPASAVRAGAILGGADQFFNNDPNASTFGRFARGIGGAALGAVTGKALDGAMTAIRARATPKLGEQALAQRDVTRQVDDMMYGAAKLQGAGKSATPEIEQAFSEPDIAPYVEAVRNTRQFKNADDATLLREAYKLMSEHQQRLGNSIADAADFKAGSTLQNNEINLAKGQLRDAGKTVMPAFPEAVSGHAENAGIQDAIGKGADAAQLAMSYIQPAGDRLHLDTPEAFSKAFEKMTRQEQLAALNGALGRVRNSLKITANPFSLYGFGSSALRAGRAAPVVQELDQLSGNRLPESIQKVILSLLAAQARP